MNDLLTLGRVLVDLSRGPSIYGSDDERNLQATDADVVNAYGPSHRRHRLWDSPFSTMLLYAS